MMSTNGFLKLDSAGKPRMTGPQALAAANAVTAAIHHAGDEGHIKADLAALVNRVATDALRDYPADRSCYGCDNLVGESACYIANDEIPADVIEVGCDSYQADGTPF